VVGYLEKHPELGRRICGIFEEDQILDRGIPEFAERLARTARAEFVDEIILAGTSSHDLAWNTIREARQNHLDVSVVPDLCGCTLRDLKVESLGEVPVVTLHQEIVPGAALILKRILDVVLAGLGLLISLPFLLLISAAVKLDSHGPVFYNAIRVGRKGRRFRCHKFRTMICDAGAIKDQLRAANQRQGPTFKIAADPRITRVGRWLRKYSLDELPQLWNVFKGEMSLVGPRPHPLDDFARYELEHLRRLDMTPGITGLWQVTARRSPSFQVNLALDLEYIESWSLWMDLRILCKTVAVVFQGTGT
jgi:exopolysaccharide biosynthesis polyprenyl glycosylphosphotransferase